MSDSTLKWGLAGYGDLAEKRVAAALQQAAGSELTGVWGRQFSKAQDFAARHGVPSAFESLNALIQSDVDAVYVCTPPNAHFEYASWALQSGKHVIIEKPMASNTRECRELIALAQKNEVKLAVAYYRRFFPKMQAVKKLIDEGVLGEVTWVNIAAHSWFAPTTDDPKHWRVEPEKSGGGGAIADIGVHRLDLLDYWLGEARFAWSHKQNIAHSYGVEDGCSAVLLLPNGAPVHTYFAWNSKTWIDRFEIVGTEGKLIAEPLDGPDLVVIRGRERQELKLSPHENVHLPLVEDFVKSVINNDTPLCDGQAGLRTSHLLEAILA